MQWKEYKTKGPETARSFRWLLGFYSGLREILGDQRETNRLVGKRNHEYLKKSSHKINSHRKSVK